jgi:hypothetical protein
LGVDWDLSWHPRARHVRENELGLTPARLRGIKESNGKLLLFVDDDNLLAPAYLATAVAIHARFRQLGAYGAGQIKGEFESPPASEIAPYLNMLTLRDVPQPIWSNQPCWNASIPYGAGLCILSEVALAYARTLESDRLRRALDRTGQQLLSCGDVDLSLFACKLGLGTGVFPELSLTHLIPSNRLERNYLVALAEGHSTSHAILASLWKNGAVQTESFFRAWFRYVRRLAFLKGIQREICRAEWRGRQRAQAWLLNSR